MNVVSTCPNVRIILSNLSPIRNGNEVVLLSKLKLVRANSICTSIWISVSTVVWGHKDQTMAAWQHVYNLVDCIGATNRIGTQGYNNVLVERIVVDCCLQQIYAHCHVSANRSVNLSIRQSVLQVRTSTKRNRIANIRDAFNNVVITCLRGVRVLAGHGHSALLLQRSVKQQVVLEIAELWSGQCNEGNSRSKWNECKAGTSQNLLTIKLNVREDLWGLPCQRWLKHIERAACKHKRKHQG